MTVLAPALGLAVLLAADPGYAQEDAQIAARRALVERDQQSEAFTLQLRQSQQRARLPPGGADSAALEELHLEQQRRQQTLHQDQLRRLSQPQDVPAALERERFARERRAQALEFELEGRTAVPEAPRRWTPTLEPPQRSWTPTLEGAPAPAPQSAGRRPPRPKPREE
jgi:hypothetical protein